MDNQGAPPKRNKSGKIVRTDQKQIIINLYKKVYFTDPDIKYDDMLKKVSSESGIGFGTIKTTIREYKYTGSTTSSPINKKKRLAIVDKVDDFDKIAIRQKIYAFWFRREYPTLSKMIPAVNDDPYLPNLSRTSFQRLLNTMDFEYTRINGISALIEKEDLVIWRRQYISDIRRYRQEGRTIYFLDETWVNAEVVAVHICSAEGFVEGGLFCYESKENSSDLMDSDTFFEWFCGTLPLLNDNSVIVMDDAPRHSVKTEQLPTTAWTNAAIVQWLESKGVDIIGSVSKFDLLREVGKIKDKYDLYVVDEEAKKQNKIVLRLPPHHYELNLVELAWSGLKDYVAENNTTFRIDDVLQLLDDGIERVTPEMWSNFTAHIIKEEDRLWQLDLISDEMMEETHTSTSRLLTATGMTTSDSESSD